jgi:hypothetical protein
MTFGGIPAKITELAQGWISVSPDDQMIAFVRCWHRPNDYCSLFVIGNDGHNGAGSLPVETSRSPGKVFATAIDRIRRGRVFNGSRAFISTVSLASGAEAKFREQPSS